MSTQEEHSEEIADSPLLMCTPTALGRLILLGIGVGTNLLFSTAVQGLPPQTVQWGASATDATGAQNRRGRNPAYAQMPYKPTTGVSRQALDDPSGAQSRSGYEDDGGALTGNFTLSIPLISAPGRGVNLNLSMIYNSNVFTILNAQRGFDYDGDWPVAGWSISFGKLTDSLLFDSDGTRHALEQVDGSHRVTTDGSLVAIEELGCSTWCTSRAHYPDGSSIDFTGGIDLTRYPTQLMDRNGNTITLNYVATGLPALSSIVDTVGRIFTFLYDENAALIAIQGPDLQSKIVDLARFHYILEHTYHTTHTADGPPRHENLDIISVIDAVYIPTTGAGWSFSGMPSRNLGADYAVPAAVATQFNAQLPAIINWHRNMSFPGNTTTDQGSVSAGDIVRTRRYDFVDDGLQPLPRIASITETWDTHPLPSVTQVNLASNGVYRTTTIIYPDGAKNVQVVDTTPGMPGSGLVYLNEVVSKDGRGLLTQMTQWEAGVDGAPRVHSLMSQNERGVASSTVYEYGPSDELVGVNEFDYANTLKRRTATSYVTDANYLAQHLVRLPQEVDIFDGTSAMPSSRVIYAYDEFPLDDAAGVAQHQSVSALRGNLTSLTTFANAALKTGAAIFHHRYDITGNLTSVSRWDGEERRYGYSLETQFAYPDNITVGATDPASPLRMMESYAYDMGIGRPVTHWDVQQLKTHLNYFPGGGLMQTDDSERGGPITSYIRQDNGKNWVREITDLSGTIIARTSTTLDGRGQTAADQWLGAHNEVLSEDYTYDYAGELVAKSLPHAAAAAASQWVTYTHDALGRFTSRTGADGSRNARYFDEVERPSAAMASAGRTIRDADAWGRDQWMLLDSLSRIIEVVEPDPQSNASVLSSANAGTATDYSYDVFGNTVQISQGAQQRSFSYDSMSRLVAAKVPEKVASLSDTGLYLGQNSAAALWCEVRSFDPRTGKIATMTDSRGVLTRFDYRSDPLGRLMRVSYTLPAGPLHPLTYADVLPAGPVNYQYASSGDLTRIARITDGSGVTQTFVYDALGRETIDTTVVGVAELSRSLSGPLASRTESPAMVTLHFYDTVGRIDMVGNTYVPGGSDLHATEVAITKPANSLAIGYGSGDGMTSLQVNMAALPTPWLVSGIAYNPSGEMLTRAFGPIGVDPVITETYGYDLSNLLQRSHTVAPAAEIVPNAGAAPLFESNSGYRAPPSGHPVPIGAEGLPEIETGQITSQTLNPESQGNQELKYDSVGRLSDATLGSTSPVGASQAVTAHYQYDRYGNRGILTANAISSAGPVSAGTDGWPQLVFDASSNRILTLGFTYDEAGNMTASPRPDGSNQTYQYDAAGRLVNVRDGAGNLLEHYIYSADRRRLATLDSQNHGILYAWDGGARIAQYGVGSALQELLLQDKSGVFAQLGTGVAGQTEIQIHVRDHGRLQGIVNVDPSTLKASMAVAVTQPYGNSLGGSATSGMPGSSTNPDPADDFPNYQRSALTGLDYANNRYYDRAQGRFLQPDPLGIDAVRLAFPQSLNMYTYVRNDPVNRSDWLGLLDSNCYSDDPACGSEGGDAGEALVADPVVVIGVPDAGDNASDYLSLQRNSNTGIDDSSIFPDEMGSGKYQNKFMSDEHTRNIVRQELMASGAMCGAQVAAFNQAVGDVGRLGEAINAAYGRANAIISVPDQEYRNHLIGGLSEWWVLASAEDGPLGAAFALNSVGLANVGASSRLNDIANEIDDLTAKRNAALPQVAASAATMIRCIAQ